MKSIPCMLSQRWNAFRVCSASDKIHSAYAQPILNDDSEMGCDMPLCWAYAEIGSSLAEHTRKLVTRWLSIRGNWLIVCWACAEIGYLIAEHMRKLVETMLFPVNCSPVPFSRPLPKVLYFLCSLSPILCSLSHVYVPCLPSTVPCLTSRFLVSHPLFPVSLLCSLFPALCLSSSVPCLTSLFLVSQ